MDIGESEVELSEERIARLNLAGEERWDSSATLNTGMRTVNITECFMRADMDGDGHSELIKVVRSGDFIDWEEFEYHPMHSITPTILTHKFFGLSIPDILEDIQEIRTSLLRSYMDNVTQTINGKTYYNKNTVNIDDMLTSLPYGLVEVNGPPAQDVFIDRPGGLPPEAFTLNELLDKIIRDRVGDFRATLDPSVLAQANTGVVMEMLQEAKSKIFMIARIFAEVGFKKLFLTLHHLARMHSNRDEVIKLRGEWVPVNPSEWRERKNLTVKVGSGRKTKREEIVYLNEKLNRQVEMLQNGIPVVTPDNIYNTVKEIDSAMDAHPEKSWTQPSQIPPPPPPQPDPQAKVLELTAQIEQLKVQQKEQQSQRDDQRAGESNQIKMAELQAKAQESASKAEIENLKLELTAMKELSQGQRDQVQIDQKERELQQAEEKLHMEAAITSASAELQALMTKYQTDTKAEVELIKIGLAAQPDSSVLIAQLTDQIGELESQLDDAEQDIEYDPDGRIVRVGKKMILRSEDGRLKSIRRKKR